MKEVDAALHRHAAAQHGLVHHRQAVAVGMSPRQIQSRLEAGLVVAVHRGVYRVAGAPTTAEQSQLAACLAGGPGAVASQRGAAWLWRLRGFDEPLAEITVPGRQLSLGEAVAHRSRRLDRIDVSRTCRIPVTTPARTLLDLGAVAPVEVVESALEDALLRRLVSFPLLVETLDWLGGPGRSGAGVLRALVEERDPATAPTQRVLEDRLLRELRRAGLPEPVRQHRVGRVVLDFAYPEHKLGIEADRRIWHGGRLDVQRNSDKANVLVARGWRVLHFTWADVRGHQVAGVVAREPVLACPA